MGQDTHLFLRSQGQPIKYTTKGAAFDPLGTFYRVGLVPESVSWTDSLDEFLTSRPHTMMREATPEATYHSTATPQTPADEGQATVPFQTAAAAE